MATLDAGTIEALIALLEDERASVEGEVALAGGATEHLERAAFVSMGGEDVQACTALHERLARADAPIPSRANAAAHAMLNAEGYDERLRIFAEHQRRVGQRAWELLEGISEREETLRRTLLAIYESHVRDAAWAERRAEEFAATRGWEPKGAAKRAAPPHTVPAERALMVMRPERDDAPAASEPAAGLDGAGSARHEEAPEGGE